MKGFLFKDAEFVTTAVSLEKCPDLKDDRGELLREIAVAGRSNVGKSSLLNDLFRAKGLVKTSATPGKTQCLNFFKLGKQLVFADLPGYGYAKVPPSVRKKWGPMIQTYLEKREPLQLILFLFDIRRVPNDEDKEFMEWIAQSGKAAILILTKADKVTRNELAANTQKILNAFACENLHYVHYSVNKPVGRDKLIKMIGDVFN
ncbi:putative GTP-binding protein EngB [Chlamydiales bacterium STE3]|nr:putative GTP-binding protein EngB [Chlamydiales bacterium STE3]